MASTGGCWSHWRVLHSSRNFLHELRLHPRPQRLWDRTPLSSVAEWQMRCVGCVRIWCWCAAKRHLGSQGREDRNVVMWVCLKTENPRIRENSPSWFVLQNDTWHHVRFANLRQTHISCFSVAAKICENQLSMCHYVPKRWHLKINMTYFSVEIHWYAAYPPDTEVPIRFLSPVAG